MTVTDAADVTRSSPVRGWTHQIMTRVSTEWHGPADQSA
jgi:hypothetical protein